MKRTRSGTRRKRKISCGLNKAFLLPKDQMNDAKRPKNPVIIRI